MGAWKEAFSVLRGTGHVPGMLWRSSREIFRAVAGWMRTGQSSGELIGRLVALCAVAYVLIYLTGGRTWLWLVYSTLWLAVCVGLAHHRKDLPWHAPTKPSRWQLLKARWNHWRNHHEDEDPRAETGAADGQDGQHGDSSPPQNDHEKVGERHHQDTAPPTPTTQNEDERDRRIALLREYVEHRVAAAVQAGARGIRTADLLAEYQVAGHLTDWGEKRFRTMLASIGIPVRDQMHFKVDGVKKNNPGVHVDDLTKTLGRAPRLPPQLLPETPPVTASIQHPAPDLILLKGEAPPHTRDGAV